MTKNKQITKDTFKLARPIIAEKLIKKAWENNSNLEGLTLKYCAENNISDGTIQNDLTLLAKFYGVSKRIVNQFDSNSNSHLNYLINARDGGYTHPSDKQTFHIHNYIVKHYK